MSAVSENQKQRWVKYGANVVLSSLIVIAIAVLITYFVQQRARRIDTTAAGLYSLRPQTITLIGQNVAPIKLVSLYRTKDDADSAPERERAQIVKDILLEYERKGRNISVEFIDPKSQPAKEDSLIQEVEQKYGGEIKAYKTFLDDYEAQHAQIQRLCSAEVEYLKAIPPLPAKELDRQTRETFREIADTVDGFPSLLDQFKEKIDRERKKKIPDYKLCAELVRSGVEGLNERIVAILGRAGTTKDNTKLPEAVRKYLTECEPRYVQIKQVAETVVKSLDTLGELKLDTLRRSLQQRDPILVMGENDIRILPFDQIWKDQIDRAPGGQSNVKFKPRFAGEQMITTAIMAIGSPTRKVVAFVRPGGPPLTDPGFPPFQPSGPMSAIADRLRQYNFEVVEKDLSGQWAIQAQMRGQPAAPEPTDDQLKSAVWVALAFPGQPGMPDAVGPAVAAHLEAGGSAFVLFAPRSAGLQAALGSWGIIPRADLIAVHEAIPSADGATAGDVIDDARRRQYIFDIREYGDHPIAQPLQSLESLMVPVSPVLVSPQPGVTTMPFIPLPSDLKTWGEKDFEALQADQSVTFDENAGDIAGPLYAAAAAEKPGGGRLVVIGSPTFAFNTELEMPDNELARQGVYVSRFPANAELFMNSIFFLSRMDSMIAISPGAMEVSRIRPMSQSTLNAWRIGLLLIGIPGSIVVAGLAVYFKRRD